MSEVSQRTGARPWALVFVTAVGVLNAGLQLGDLGAGWCAFGVIAGLAIRDVWHG